MSWIGSLISGIFDVGTSIYNQESQKAENEKSRDFAASQQEDSQAFNAEEAQKARDFAASQQEDSQAFNAEQAAMNRQFQSKEAEAAFEREKAFYEEYQSIGAQVRQYQEAGLNPALMYGGVSVGSTPSSPAAAGSAASSTPSSVGSAAASSPVAAAMSSLPEVAMIGKHLAEIANIKADTRQKEKSTEKTAQEILTEQQNTEVARATAAEIGTRTQLAVDRWAKEGLKIDAEISKIGAETATESAKKEELIAEKLLKETMQSYEKWKTDTAALRYWTSTGFYALSSGLSQLVNAGVNVINIKNIFKGKLQNELKLPNPEVNLPNGVHKSEEVEFFDSLSEILESM